MRTFVITDEQLAKVEAWQKDHVVMKGRGKGKKKCNLRCGTMGDLEHYRICPTGIGDFISVHCPCGAELDLNDYESF